MFIPHPAALNRRATLVHLIRAARALPRSGFVLPPITSEAVALPHNRRSRCCNAQAFED